LASFPVGGAQEKGQFILNEMTKEKLDRFSAIDGTALFALCHVESQYPLYL
jgi:hypothetical protein